MHSGQKSKSLAATSSTITYRITYLKFWPDKVKEEYLVDKAFSS